MTLARRLATGDTYAVFVTSRMRTETRASSASVYDSSVMEVEVKEQQVVKSLSDRRDYRYLIL